MTIPVFAVRNRLIERLRSKALLVLLLGSVLLGAAVPWALNTTSSITTISMQFLLCGWLIAIYAAVSLCRILRFLATECRHGANPARILFVTMLSFIPEVIIVALVMSECLILAPNLTNKLETSAAKAMLAFHVGERWLQAHDSESEKKVLIPDTTSDIDLKIWQFCCYDFPFDAKMVAPNYLLEVLHVSGFADNVIGSYKCQIFIGMLLAGGIGCAVGGIFVGILQREERVLSGLTVFYGIALLFSPVVLQESSWLLPIVIQWHAFEGFYPGNCPKHIAAGEALKYLLALIFPGRWLWTVGTFPFKDVSQLWPEALYPILLGFGARTSCLLRLRELSKQIRSV